MYFCKIYTNYCKNLLIFEKKTFLKIKYAIIHLIIGFLFRRVSMKIAILEDNTQDAALLLGYVEKYAEERQLSIDIFVYHDGEDFLEAFTEENFSLIFLDIIMPNINGMEVAKHIRMKDQECLLVFTTSSRDYAVEGYHVQASYYLVKPFSYIEFIKAMNLCHKRLKNTQEFIEIKEGRLMVKILIKDILYTDYYNHYIQIHTKNRTYRTYLSFADFSPMLLKYSNFISSYRNLLVNLDYVESLNDKDFILKNNCHIPITKAKRLEVRQQYADYLFEKLNRGS